MQVNKTGHDLDFVTAKDEYCIAWDGADAESGVASSEVSICSILDPDDCLLQGSNVGNRTSVCLADLEFQEGVQYAATVRVRNEVGLSAGRSSDGFMVDSTPPSVGGIVHIENPSVDGEHFTHSLTSVQWTGFLDKESGVSRYYVCVGTQPGQCGVRNWSQIVNGTHVTIADSGLVHLETYYVSVTAENHAGLRTEIRSSDGVTVDKTGVYRPILEIFATDLTPLCINSPQAMSVQHMGLFLK